MCINTRFIHFV